MCVYIMNIYIYTFIGYLFLGQKKTYTSQIAGSDYSTDKSMEGHHFQSQTHL